MNHNISKPGLYFSPQQLSDSAISKALEESNFYIAETIKAMNKLTEGLKAESVAALNEMAIQLQDSQPSSESVISNKGGRRPKNNVKNILLDKYFGRTLFVPCARPIVVQKARDIDRLVDSFRVAFYSNGYMELPKSQKSWCIYYAWLHWANTGVFIHSRAAVREFSSPYRRDFINPARDHASRFELLRTLKKTIRGLKCSIDHPIFYIPQLTQFVEPPSTKIEAQMRSIFRRTGEWIKKGVVNTSDLIGSTMSSSFIRTAKNEVFDPAKNFIVDIYSQIKKIVKDLYTKLMEILKPVFKIFCAVSIIVITFLAYPFAKRGLDFVASIIMLGFSKLVVASENLSVPVKTLVAQNCNKMMEELRDPHETMVSQSVGSFVSLLMTSAYALLHNEVPGHHVKSVSMFNGLFRLGDSIMKGVMAGIEAIPKILNYLNCWYHGIPTESQQLEDMYKKLTTDVDEYLSLPPHQFMSRISEDKEYALKIIKVYHDFLRVKEIINKDPAFTAAQRSTFSLLHLRFRDLYAKAMAAKSMHSSRQIPVFLWMVGDSGVGKSKAIDLIAHAVRQLLIKKGLVEGQYNPMMRYERKSTTEFWDFYSSQWLTSWDDVFQVKDTKDRSIAATELIYAGNSNVFPLPMAHLENKGTCTFESKLMVATTNDTNPGRDLGIQSPEALLRRRDFIVKVTLPRRDYSPSSPLCYKNYDFFMMKDDKDKKPTPMTFAQLVVEIANLYEQRAKEAKDFTSDLGQMDWLGEDQFKQMPCFQAQMKGVLHLWDDGNDRETQLKRKTKKFSYVPKKSDVISTMAPDYVEKEDDSTFPAVDNEEEPMSNALIKYEGPSETEDSESDEEFSDFPVDEINLSEFPDQDVNEIDSGQWEPVGKSYRFPIEKINQSIINEDGNWVYALGSKLQDWVRTHPDFKVKAHCEGDFIFPGTTSFPVHWQMFNLVVKKPDGPEFKNIFIQEGSNQQFPVAISHTSCADVAWISNQVYAYAGITVGIVPGRKYTTLLSDLGHFNRVDVEYIIKPHKFEIVYYWGKDNVTFTISINPLTGIPSFDDALAFTKEKFFQGVCRGKPDISYSLPWPEVRGKMGQTRDMCLFDKQVYIAAQLSNFIKKGYYAICMRIEVNSRTAVGQAINMFVGGAVGAAIGLAIKACVYMLCGATNIDPQSNPEHARRLAKKHNKDTRNSATRIFKSGITGESLKSQGLEPNFADIAHKFLAWNFEIGVHNAGYGTSTRVQFLEGRVGVIPYHAMYALGEVEKFSLFQPEGGAGALVIPVSRCQIRPFPERDLVVVFFDHPNVPPAPKLSKHFLAKDIESVALPVRVTKVEKEGVHYVSYVTGTQVSSGIPCVTKYPDSGIDGPKSAVVSKYYYALNCPGKAGDCAYPYFTAVEGLQQRFLGLHIGEGPSGSTFSRVFPEELYFEGNVSMPEVAVPKGFEECSLENKMTAQGLPIRKGIIVHGVSKRLDFTPKNTAIHKLPFSKELNGIPPVHEIEYKPAALRPIYDDEQVLHDPIKKNFDKYGLKTINCYIGENDYMCYKNLFPKHMSGKKFRILTPHEAIFGCPQLGVPALPRNTSMGWPWIWKGKQKSDYIDWDKETIHPALLGAINDEFERLKTGLTQLVYLDCLKDELRPREKAEKASSRLFARNSYHQMVVSRMLFGPIVFNAMNTDGDSAMLGAVNHATVHWDRVFKEICELANVMAGDFGKYDISHLPIFQEFVYKSIEPFCSTQMHKTMCLNYLRSKAFCIHVCGSLIYSVIGSSPSGDFLTLFGNNIINRFIHCTVFRRLYPSLDYSDYVRDKFCGDDCLAGVSKYTPLFNQISMSYICWTWFSMEYTDANKSTNFQKYTPIDELTFCKRSFVFYSKYPYCFAPLDEKAIAKIVQYSQDKEKPIHIQQEIAVDTALREWFFHGPVKYASMLKEYNLRLEQMGCSPVQITWGELFQKFASTYYVL